MRNFIPFSDTGNPLAFPDGCTVCNSMNFREKIALSTVVR